MIRPDFEHISALQLRVRALEAQVKELKSGEKYQKLEEEYKAFVRFHNKEVKRLEYELSKAHSETVTVRRYWGEVMDDLDKEHREEVEGLREEICHLKERILSLECQRDEAKDKLRDRTQEYYAVSVQLEEEKEKNRKLTAQANKDFENSSLPSSLQKGGRKKIPNSREKTGRKPGGQPGHKGHGRRMHGPTESHEIPSPEYEEDPHYYETGRIIRKQKVFIELGVRVVEYTTKEYRDRRTGARVHAPFPEGYVNEVGYDSTVKAVAFLLCNECNVSHGKIRKLLSELTEGNVQLSDGLINGLAREFSEKTAPERQEIIRRLMRSPVMNADFTNASVNGKSAQVVVLASPSEGVALYTGKEKKGHEGIKGTPLYEYVGTVVHDHDTTFYSYGSGHQECIQHNLRYLKGSEQNEPGRTWNKQMHELFRRMLHYRNSLEEGEELDQTAVEGYEAEYDRILKEAEKEYEDEPPGDYYREGYNLYLRLKKYRENELLFLHDKRVPADNSLCERLARVYKRKQKQAVTLRSQESLCSICDGLSVVHLLRQKGGNVYREIAEIYERRKPKEEKEETGAGA